MAAERVTRRRFSHKQPPPASEVLSATALAPLQDEAWTEITALSSDARRKRALAYAFAPQCKSASSAHGTIARARRARRAERALACLKVIHPTTNLTSYPYYVRALAIPRTPCTMLKQGVRDFCSRRVVDAFNIVKGGRGQSGQSSGYEVKFVARLTTWTSRSLGALRAPSSRFASEAVTVRP